MMTELVMFTTVFFAIFTQSVSGFGLALVSMPILVSLIGVRTAAPLIVLVAVISEAVLLLRYREHISIVSVWRLTAACAVGIPIGVWALGNISEVIVLKVLGVLIIAYSLYALLNFALPKMQNNIWPYSIGFLAGLFGGAYNLTGPPVIVYGNCRRWQPGEFKGNLQGFFLVGSIIAVVSHALASNITQDVMNKLLVCLPAVGLGLIAGLSLDKFINPNVFRKIVLFGLLFAGVRLIFV